MAGMFALGQPCSLSVDTSKVAPTSAILTEKNSLRLKEGAHIRIRTATAILYRTVGQLAGCSDLVNRDNILLGSSVTESSGHYKEVSSFRHSMHNALGTKKAKYSAAATACSMASAAGAAIYASMKDCNNIGCVRIWTWILIAVSAAASLIAWARDNEVF